MPAPDPARFERLGQFYLGRVYDPVGRARTDDLLLYDARDLVTHAVCVGMTGSGKTGLCLNLLEEAALDGIPALIVDPKGDLANLLLTFPTLDAAAFRPWINLDDAHRKGVEPDPYAAQQAQQWAAGLAEWGQDGARIARLRAAADFAVYTPGSTAGLPLAVLRSLDPPPAAIADDPELLAERLSATATALLGLLGIAGDPLQSREHILIAHILAHAWSEQRGLDLAALVAGIQQPGVDRIGVMELETFFPASERFKLALQVNNLVASPAFARWTQGAPLDIASLLYTPDGRPRHSVLSIAHLSDSERMFFVALVATQVLGWMRTQSGTTSLRAILYMDEVAGYLPPVANPPSKPPLLTLLKQGRAFGLGVVLATQNPVDLDYKALSNCGTWFIGRLQTDRDKQRVLDGLEGAASAAGRATDRATLDALLSSLSQRIFLMNNIHDDGPTVFETRWCMSYLRGPLTRDQLRSLTQPSRTPSTSSASSISAPLSSSSSTQAVPASPGSSPLTSRTPSSTSATSSTSPLVLSSTPRSAAATRPVLPPEIPEYFLPVARSAVAIEYRPALLGVARVLFTDTKLAIEHDAPVALLAEFDDGPVVLDWERAEPAPCTDEDVEHEPAPAAQFARLPADAAKPRAYESWRKSLADVLYRTQRLELHHHADLEVIGRPGESASNFHSRVADAARSARDATTQRLRAKYAPRLATLQERLRRAQQQLEVQEQQASAAKTSGVIGIGSALLGAFLGRKLTSAANVGRAASAARGMSRSAKEQSDVGRAHESVEAVCARIRELESEFQDELDRAAAELAPGATSASTITLKPKKTNISVRAVILAWAPHAANDGRPLWRSPVH